MAEVDEQATGRMADTLRKLFSRVLKELADLDNPMRSHVSDGLDDPAMWLPSAVNGHEPTPLSPPAPESPRNEPWSAPRIDDLLPDANAPIRRPPPSDDPRGDKTRTSELPSVQPDPEPTERRSRFDAADRVVLYNDHHADYLLVKDDEGALLDYLATLIAKEYVLYNNPRANPDDLAEEMVRMMVRVRRHMPRRR
jgi:hypothetical protein